MTAFAFEGTPGRRFDGAGRVIGLGQACANGGGAATTKSNNNCDTDAWPANAGRANTTWHGAGVWSDEPKRRPDHKAKRHGRPVRQKHKRRRSRVREALELVAAGALSLAVTLAAGWPLRFEGEMLWVAMTTL